MRLPPGGRVAVAVAVATARALAARAGASLPDRQVGARAPGALAGELNKVAGRERAHLTRL
jgi:hypothetical protein